MARKLAARKESGYDSKVDGRRESFTPKGDHTINTSVAAVRLIRPMYEKGPLVYRIFPCRSYTEPNTKLLRGRKSAEPGDYTEWQVRVAAAKMVGMPDCDTITFNLYSPTKKDKAYRDANPYSIFYWACKRACDSGEFGNGQAWDARWNKLMKGSKKTGAANIKPPEAIFYSQGAVYINGDKDYMDGERTKPLGLSPDDDLVIVANPQSAGPSITELFDKQKDEYDSEAAEKSYSVPFVFGDPVGVFNAKERVVKGGKFIQIFNPKVTKVKGPNSTWDGKIKDISGYEAAVLGEFKDSAGVVHTPSLDSDDVDVIFDKVQFWWDDEDSGEKGILNFPDYEEQASLVARAFKTIPSLLRFAWADNEEYMTDDVKGILAARVSTVIPGKDGEEGEEGEEGAPATSKKPKTATDPTVRAGKPPAAKKGGKPPAPAPEEEEEGEEEEETTEEEEEEVEGEEEETTTEEEEETTEEEEEEEVEGEEEEEETTTEEEEEVEGEEEATEEEEEATTEEEEEEATEEEEEEEEEEEAAPPPPKTKPKTVVAGKPAAKPAAGKPAGKPKPAATDDIDDLLEDTGGMAASLAAAKGAKARSALRTTPDKAPPAAPPASRGGTATKPAAKPAAKPPVKPAGKPAKK